MTMPSADSLPPPVVATAAVKREKIRAEVTVTNVVITVVLGGLVNLKLFGSIPNTDARLGQFPALQVHFKDGRLSTVLIFRTSTMTVPGNRSQRAALLCAQSVRIFLERLATNNYRCEHYRTLGWPHRRLTREEGTFFEFRNYRIVNVVVTVRTSRGINLDSLSKETAGHTIYQPDMFPAAKFQPDDAHIYGCCINYFETGRFNVMGAHSLSHAISATRVALAHIYGHWRDDVHPNPNARYISRVRRYGGSDMQPPPGIQQRGKRKRDDTDGNDKVESSQTAGTLPPTDARVSRLADEYGMPPDDFLAIVARLQDTINL
jgi:TATA-box binding protein (TBP) (component of TFIID and TFIIIB)